MGGRRRSQKIFGARTARALLLAGMLCAPAQASADGGNLAPDPAPALQATEPRWEIGLSPYLWALAIDGDIDARGVRADVHASFSDILDNLNFAAMAVLEARRERWVGMVDGFWAVLQDDETHVGPFSAELKSRVLTTTSKVGYRVWSEPAADRSHPRFALDLQAGARYVRVANSIELGFLGFNRTATQRFHWVDSLIGFTARGDLGPFIELRLSADIGGFDIGSASRLTWSALALLTYRISPHWAFSVGYRGLDVDREHVDVRAYGPVLSVTYRWFDEH